MVTKYEIVGEGVSLYKTYGGEGDRYPAISFPRHLCNGEYSKITTAGSGKVVRGMGGEVGISGGVGVLQNTVAVR